MAALIAEYRRSDKWRELAPTSRTERERIFGELESLYGEQSAADLERVHIIAIRSAFATDADGTPTPYRGNKVIAIISLLLTFAMDIGWRKDNPALRPGRLKTGPGYATWTADDFRQFMDCPDISEAVKRAVALGFYTGLRISDAIALPKSARRGGAITVTPQKTANSTRAKVKIPEHPELTRILNAAPRSDSTTLLTTQHGLPWTANNLKHRLVAGVRAAGIPAGLSYHGLRKGLTAALAEAGATDAEIDSIIPHSDAGMTRHYRAQANQRVIADAAIARLPDRRGK